ncbi:hypothetical protein ACOIOT_000037 [Cronobacter turicensis]
MKIIITIINFRKTEGYEIGLMMPEDVRFQYSEWGAENKYMNPSFSRDGFNGRGKIIRSIAPRYTLTPGAYGSQGKIDARKSAQSVLIL